MANTYFSDEFAAAAADIAAADSQVRPPVGKAHGRIYHKHASANMSIAVVATDIIRLAKVKSADRVKDIIISSDSAAGSGSFDIGLYEKGADNDGAAVDIDLFGAAVAFSGGLDRVDQFDAGANDELDRGKQLWELAGLASDPGQEWHIALTCTIAVITANLNVLLELNYMTYR